MRKYIKTVSVIIACFLLFSGCRTVQETEDIQNEREPIQDHLSEGFYNKPSITDTPVNTPEPEIIKIADRVKEISAGDTHTVILKDDGSVWAWGSNKYGQLGDGTTEDRQEPVQVAGLAGIKHISAGTLCTMALKEDGSVWAWGLVYNGSNDTMSVPVRIDSLDGAAEIQSDIASIALKADGTVWTWGRNDYGRLGHDTGSDIMSPEQIIGINNASDVDMSSHAIILKQDGTVWSWGSNFYGQLGDGTAEEKHQPVQVIGIDDVIDIEAGFTHTVALRGDGTVWCWGDNMNGQLGNGTNEDSLKPVMAEGLDQVVSISARGAFSLALKNDGTVWSWGINNFGQLGDGTGWDESKPVKVAGLKNIKAIASGNYHAVALEDDGTVWTWGNNTDGQLGMDKDEYRSFIPRQVSAFGDIKTPIGIGIEMEEDSELFFKDNYEILTEYSGMKIELREISGEENRINPASDMKAFAVREGTDSYQSISELIHKDNTVYCVDTLASAYGSPTASSCYDLPDIFSDDLEFSFYDVNGTRIIIDKDNNLMAVLEDFDSDHLIIRSVIRFKCDLEAIKLSAIGDFLNDGKNCLVLTLKDNITVILNTDDMDSKIIQHRQWRTVGSARYCLWQVNDDTDSLRYLSLYTGNAKIEHGLVGELSDGRIIRICEEWDGVINCISEKDGRYALLTTNAQSLHFVRSIKKDDEGNDFGKIINSWSCGHAGVSGPVFYTFVYQKEAESPFLYLEGKYGADTDF